MQKKHYLEYFGEVKKYNVEKNTIIAIGGCMMQEKEMQEKVLKSFPFVKLIFGTHTLHNFPKGLYQVLTEGKRIFDVIDIKGEIYEGIPVKRMDGLRASVTIMYGCNNFCTFCIVPYVRGRERSRKAEDILKEVEELAQKGYLEITLLGQNVNSYRGEGEIDTFAKLLDKVASIEGIKKVRFMSPHPKDFTEDVVQVMKKHENISRTLHYPLQSGSSNILKKMNRRYTKEQYLERAENIRRELPDVTFTTDIIVGFPGETEEDFQDTLDVVRKMNFEQVFMFIYSPRENTPAKKMEQVDENIAKERFQRLKEMYDKQAEKLNEKYLGKEEWIIVDGISKKNAKMLVAKTDANKPVVFEKYEGWKMGDYIKIRIVETHTWYLVGEKIS